MRPDAVSLAVVRCAMKWNQELIMTVPPLLIPFLWYQYPEMAIRSPWLLLIHWPVPISPAAIVSLVAARCTMNWNQSMNWNQELIMAVSPLLIPSLLIPSLVRYLTWWTLCLNTRCAMCHRKERVGWNPYLSMKCAVYHNGMMMMMMRV